MPSKLIRVVLDLLSNNFIVEYGNRRVAGLTQAQQKEMKQLNEDLMEFSDFALAETLGDEERQALMVKKKRFEELAEKEILEHIEWYPIEKHLIHSLLVVVQQNMFHTYVENLPSYLLDRILDPKGNVTINVGAAPSTSETPIPLDEKEREERKEWEERAEDDMGALQSHTQPELTVIRIIAPDMPGWADLLTIKQEGSIVFIRPNAFLADRWNPINRALREVYGECWISTGKGDKSAHWQVKV